MEKNSIYEVKIKSVSASGNLFIGVIEADYPWGAY